MKRPTLQTHSEIGRGSAIVLMHADCFAGSAA